MPTYEYACAKCKRRFERWQTMTERPLRKCPRCGSMSARRLIGAGAGVIFKGSGFYGTDYRKPRDTPRDKAPAAPEKKPSSDGPSAGKQSPATS